MGPIGLLLVALGMIGLIYGIFQRMKAGRVTDAPLASTGDAAARGASLAGPKGQISAQGAVLCQQPLMSPVTGTPCLFYDLKVTAEWKDGDTTKTKELDHQKVAAQIALNDGSGPVWVDLREGGDFEPTMKKEMEQSTGVLKGIVGGEISFGSYRVNAGIGSLGTTYKVVEEVLPVQQSLYVCGKMGDNGGVIVAPKWRSMIVSNQTRDQLLAAATKSAKIALIAGAATFVVGGALAGIASAMGPSPQEVAAAEAAASASAAAAMSALAAAASADNTADPEEVPSPSASASTAPVKAPVRTAPAKLPVKTSQTPKPRK